MQVACINDYRILFDDAAFGHFKELLAFVVAVSLHSEYKAGAIQVADLHGPPLPVPQALVSVY